MPKHATNMLCFWNDLVSVTQTPSPSSPPQPTFNADLLWKPAGWASNLSLFFLTLPRFLALWRSFIKNRGWASDTSWQAAAWSVLFIHLDIFSAKKKQAWGTCSIHFHFYSLLFRSCFTNSLVGCCLIPSPWRMLGLFWKGSYFLFPWEFPLPGHVHKCVCICIFLAINWSWKVRPRSLLFPLQIINQE